MTVPTSDLLRQIAARDIPPSLDLWPGVRAALSVRRRAIVRQRALQLVALATVVCGLVAASAMTSTGTPTVSAEVILDRAGAAVDGLVPNTRPYHITATRTVRPADGALGRAVVEQEETWFGGQGRMRQEVRAADWTTLTISNETQSWWSVTHGGRTYATLANGIRFSDTARLNPLAPEGANIASVIALVRQSGCGIAELRGEETVAGRAAYVVAVTHTLKTGCGDALRAMAQPSPAPKLDATALATQEALIHQKQAAVATETAAHRPNEAPASIVRAEPSPVSAARGEPAPVSVARAEPSPASVEVRKPVDPRAKAEIDRLMNAPMTDTFWIDKQTFVQLKSELNIGPKGTALYEVTSVTYDESIPSAMFDYTPGRNVQVSTNPADVKQQLATEIVRPAECVSEPPLSIPCTSPKRR
jgi:hypothetical protein